MQQQNPHIFEFTKAAGRAEESLRLCGWISCRRGGERERVRWKSYLTYLTEGAF